MIDPFTAWSRMVAAGLDMQSTWLRSVETLQASRTVIGARTDLMRGAIASPMKADVAEFARMVPEKVEAFSQSARALTRDTMAMHAAWASQMQRVGAMMMAGRIPTLIEAAKLATQTAEYSVGAMTASAKLSKDALAPVHRTAAGNARRLKRVTGK